MPGVLNAPGGLIRLFKGSAHSATASANRFATATNAAATSANKSGASANRFAAATRAAATSAIGSATSANKFAAATSAAGASANASAASANKSGASAKAGKAFAKGWEAVINPELRMKGRGAPAKPAALNPGSAGGSPAPFGGPPKGGWRRSSLGKHRPPVPVEPSGTAGQRPTLTGDRNSATGHFRKIGDGTATQRWAAIGLRYNSGSKF